MLLVLAAVAIFVVLAAMRSLDSLPALAPQAALDFIAADPTSSCRLDRRPSSSWCRAPSGRDFLVAALLAHRSFRRSGRAGDALLAAGMLIAAFSQINSAIHPGSYSSVVTIGDLLRLGFFVVILVGVVAESRDDLEDLRAANIEVRRLADAELAAPRSRSVPAWRARSTTGSRRTSGTRSSSRADWPRSRPRGRAEAADRRGGDALDNALAEARHAVAAMRRTSENGPLLDLLARLVEDFADRFALRAELHDEGPAPEIGARAQAEVLRIVQEALTNVRKHADATVVRVGVATGERSAHLVTDNGRGFHPEAVHGGFGLDSMRQRAALIGATLTITSQPRDGSRVELVHAAPRRGDRWRLMRRCE